MIQCIIDSKKKKCKENPPGDYSLNFRYNLNNFE